MDRPVPALKARAKMADGVQRAFPRAGARAEFDVILSLLCTARLHALAEYLEAIGPIAGDTAEVGVAGGGTSALIAASNGGRTHWVCDTFEGLLDVGVDDTPLENGMFLNERTTLEAVQRLLAGLDNVRFVQGYFPASAPEAMKTAKFALVHLDVDTYRSTINGFEFFASRIAPGGVLLIDDALEGRAPGAQKAWQEIASRSGQWSIIGCTRQQVALRFA